MYGSLGSLDTAAAYYSEAPVPVYGGARFKQLTTLYHTVCGLQLNGSALCWGGEPIIRQEALSSRAAEEPAPHCRRHPQVGGERRHRPRLACRPPCCAAPPSSAEPHPFLHHRMLRSPRSR